MERGSAEFDLLIVGAGPAGLSAAIRFKQLCNTHQRDFSVCVLEKGSQVGAHLLSGAVLEPRALKELLPDCWEQAPLGSCVTQDYFYYLTKRHAIRLPTPKPMCNKGNSIIRLSSFCAWLAKQAESLDVEIYTGFAAADLIFKDAMINGVMTGDLGLNKRGEAKATFEPGMALHAPHTLLAEGCRGSLSQRIIHHYQLNQGKQPQTYGLGIKEVWEIDPNHHQPGKIIHTIGWPLHQNTYGGSFIYHLNGPSQIAIGFVVGLDYNNPYLDPFFEMQRFKTHPNFKPLFEKNATRISYGARTLNEGGWQSRPELVFPGGALIGCSAGFLNVPKIKGIHTAMKSGMLAAEQAFHALSENTNTLLGYTKAIKNSWIEQELYHVRNIRPAFRYGLWAGLIWAAFDTYLINGRWPWTFKQNTDHNQLKPRHQVKPIVYPKPDYQITFDKLSSVYLTNTYHNEDQPVHLKLHDPDIPIKENLPNYGAPEQRYCPAGVYEIVDQGGQATLQINAQNCIHCKTCDIKDPTQNITWLVPEGGSGPNYSDM